jgi:hypothetical protein
MAGTRTDFVFALLFAVKRFGRQLAALTCGRVCLVSGSSATLAVALTIAIRFAAGRKQFGPPGEPEQRTLAPPHFYRFASMCVTQFSLRAQPSWTTSRTSVV